MTQGLRVALVVAGVVGMGCGVEQTPKDDAVATAGAAGGAADATAGTTGAAAASAGTPGEAAGAGEASAGTVGAMAGASAANAGASDVNAGAAAGATQETAGSAGNSATAGGADVAPGAGAGGTDGVENNTAGTAAAGAGAVVAGQAGADTSDDPPEDIDLSGASAISDLTITPNPNSTLSAFVSWTTTEPANSVVQFGAGELKYQIDDAAEVTEHRVLVIGMRAETDYTIRAISTGASGAVTADGSFTTGALPARIPMASVTVGDAARVQPGWTLMNVQAGDGTVRAQSGAPPAAVIYDSEGYPVWYWINGTQNERGGDVSVDSTDRGVLMGPARDTNPPVEVDWAGEVLWTCADTLCGGQGSLTHHAGKLSNGDFVFMREVSMGSRTSPVFEVVTQDNTPVFQVGVEDLLTPPGGASGDWAHGNSITIDLDNDVAYMSMRWLGVAKMTYSTKTLQWHLPASYGASGMGDMTFVPPESQFSDIHDPEIHDDGTILFFDNGGFTGQIAEGNPGNLHTRAVEYLIDEQAKTATLVWEWPGDFDTDPFYKQDLYVPFWGDADRLANGNVLIAAGRRGVQEITPESRVIEVAKDDGAVVWELRLPRDYGVYRAERMYPLPLVKELAP